MVAKKTTDTNLKEFKILYPTVDVEICGHTFTIKQWSALKAKENAKNLQGPFVKLAGGSLTPELISEVFDEAFEEIVQVIAEDYGLEESVVGELPAPDALRAFKGIIEANLSFFGELSEVQKMVNDNL